MTVGTESHARIFVDTNIWLYAFIANQGLRKHAIAHELVSARGICISVQVINEVSVNLLRGCTESPDCFAKLAMTLCRASHCEFSEAIW